MINNQSNQPEKFEPKDSEDINHLKNDDQSVLKPEDQNYKKKDADFQPPPAESKEKSEQPVHPVKDAPKEK